MPKNLIRSITLLFERQPKPENLLSPRWNIEGVKYAAYWQKRLPSENEVAHLRALKESFDKLYKAHTSACKEAQEPAAIPKIALDKFKQGWHRQFTNPDTIKDYNQLTTRQDESRFILSR